MIKFNSFIGRCLIASRSFFSLPRILNVFFKYNKGDALPAKTRRSTIIVGCVSEIIVISTLLFSVYFDTMGMADANVQMFGEISVSLASLITGSCK